ncbi:MAG TPA: carboxylesterase/lipase family protein [Streptosporangiaceae bacterium]|nr:carboxylesterase/lipase family protein [Streptosporangiaceae bacterium]
MESVVTTAYGKVRGLESDGVASFKGISYAAPPFGQNRLRPPARPEPWAGVRDATAYGPTVPKPPYPEPYDRLLPEPVIAGDDCLNLNVWTPDPGGAGLPVMVWIHGGAFVNGSGAVAQYAGDRFARDGIVCVTINYRLGCEGFLFLDDAVPNRGLLDQIAALQWVQENIAGFGGDPGNVTIFGESAGAMSVTALLSMPTAAGLFRRAIPQSGAGHHVLPADTAREVSAELARRLGVAATWEDFAAVPVDRLVAAQRQLSADIVWNPDPGRWREVAANAMAFEPVVDGQILPARPIDAIAGGNGRGVDLLVGTNRDEEALFFVPTGAVDAIDDTALQAVAGAHGLDAAGVALYRAGTRTPSAGDALMGLMTDWFFRIPAIRLAEKHHGEAYMYEFAWKSPLFGGRLGACHALEIGFVFDTLDVEGGDDLYGSSPPADLAATMHRAWVEFARSGRPGWAAYDLDTRATMTFDLDSALVQDPRPEQRLLWQGIR